MQNIYWNNRYLDKNTPWDASRITTPIKEYVDQLEDKDLKILIPGAGNGHEASYLFEQGFRNVWICDWAEAATQQFAVQNPDFPKEQIICGDFFQLETTFDLIIEQTFFCALPPTMREAYAKKVAESLDESGKLVGLLFDFPLTEQGPPFGGTKDEYIKYFEPFFEFKIFEKSYNSIKPRAGKEYFILFQKKSKISV